MGPFFSILYICFTRVQFYKEGEEYMYVSWWAVAAVPMKAVAIREAIMIDFAIF